MPSIRDLIPWSQLTRNGVPDQFRIIRRPLTVGEVTFPVGTTVDSVGLFLPAVARLRLRQFYQQRLIEPVSAPKGSRQAHRPNPNPNPALAAVNRPAPSPSSLPRPVRRVGRVVTEIPV